MIQDAGDYGGHQARLRGGGLVAADSLHPLDFNFAGAGIVEIFSVGDFVGAEGVDEGVGFSVVDVIVFLDVDARLEMIDIEGDLHRLVLGEADVHEDQRAADGEQYPGHLVLDADDERDLLPVGRGADEVTGF